MKILLLLFSLSTFASLPKDLKWITNDKEPLWASSQAKKGGTLNTFVLSFPLTLRHVGPDSNGAFATVVRGLLPSLTTEHPNNHKTIPVLATHWAYGKDGKTVYYKLDKNAKWSDGKPLTADDFLFTLEFMRSKHIVAPWYNNHYKNEIKEVKKYDDHTISVTGATKKSKRLLHYYYGLSPTPKHFYKLDKDFVRNFNWKIPPTLAPYQISEVRKGKHITLKRIKDWWGKDKRYNKNRFNVDRIKFTIIRDLNVAYEHFRKGKIDAFPLTLPYFWHDKAKGKEYSNGYIHKMWFYVDQPQPNYGFWLNQSREPFNDKNVRLGFNHSLNFQKVLKTVLRGDYQRLQHLSTGYGPYSNKSIKARTFDLKKADRYYSKAGWNKRGPDGIRTKGGKRLSVTVTYGQKNHEERLVILKEEAKKAGLELKLKLLDGAAAFKSMLEKQHQVGYSGWSTAIVPQYWGGYHSKNADKPQTNNFTNMKSKKLDKLIDEYKSSYDEKRRHQLAQQIQKYIHDNADSVTTWLAPFFRFGYWAYWQFPKVPATKMSQSLFGMFDITGGLFWLDKEAKKKVRGARKKNQKLPVKTIVDKTYKI